jgi:hypothetical protein
LHHVTGGILGYQSTPLLRSRASVRKALRNSGR